MAPGIAAAGKDGKGVAADAGTAAVGLQQVIDAGSGATLGSVPVGPNPRHVAVSGDGASAYVSRFVTPPLPGEGTVNVQTMAGGVPVGAIKPIDRTETKPG